MRARIGDAAAETVRAFEIGERLRHVRHHGLVILAADLPSTMALGEADHADRQGRPAGNAALHFEPVVDGAAPGTIELGEIEPDQLRAAAADIEDERPIAIAVDQRGAARHRELRLGLPAHDLDGKTGVATHPVDELAAIGGDPARLGGDQARARHAAPPHLVRADLERVDGAVHGGVGQMAGAQHPLAEANDAGEGIDDEKAAARRSCHQEPAIVGAEVERPVNRNCGAPRRARPHRSCPGLPPISPQPAPHTAHGPRLTLGRRPPRSRWSRSAWTLCPAEAWQPCGHCRSAQSRCLTLMSAALAYRLGSQHARPRQWFDIFTVARS